MQSETIKRGALLIVSLLLFLYVLLRLDIGVAFSYRDLLVDANAYGALQKGKSPVPDPDPPGIEIDGQALAYDRRSKKFLVSLPEGGTDNPTVHVTSSVFQNYELAVRGDLFGENPDIGARLMLYNDREYKEFRIESTPLPVLQITVENPVHPDRPVGQEDQKARMILFDNRSGLPQEERMVRAQSYIRLRGDSSLNYPKRQYRINLREFSVGGAEEPLHLSFLGLRNDDDWILGTPFNDPHKIRSAFAYQLWYDTAADNNPYGISTGTQTRFVELFIGGDYRGIYTLMHPVDAKQLALSNDPREGIDYHYRAIGTEPFDPQDFTDHAPLEIRGRFELRDPEPDGSPQQWEPLVRHMQALTASKEELALYLDRYTWLPNQIDYYLFTLLLQARDNELKNHDYIAYRETEGHRILEAPWDLDLILGLVWNVNMPMNINAFWGTPGYVVPPRDSHIQRAIEQENTEIIRAVQQRWGDLRADEWSNARLLERIDAYERDLFDSGAVHRDRIRWPYAAYTDSLDSFRSYLLDRIDVIDDLIDRLGE